MIGLFTTQVVAENFVQALPIWHHDNIIAVI